MNRKIESILEQYREEMVLKLQELIRIESTVESDSGKCSREAPFGTGPLRALQYMMALGEEKGFQCTNYDNMICELKFAEEKEDAVGAALHLDVVPAGGKWTHPPYGGELHNGRIYGRGAVDDKGPAIAVFYAALAIRESGLPLRRTITQIIGTNEESGRFPCLRHYLQIAEKIPSCGIVPDSYFPICFSEKHFVNIRLFLQSAEDCGNAGTAHGAERVLKRIRGGDAVNVVPSWAEAVLAEGEGRKEEQETILRETGITAHASTPEQGENAVAKLLNRLAEQEFAPHDICRALKQLAPVIAQDTNGAGLGIDFRDETGETTSNVGLISYENGLLEIEANLRLPLSLDQKELLERVSKAISDSGVKVEVTNFLKGFYADPQQEPAKTLLAVYREETGDLVSEPYANGSGSYARIMNDFIPFGIALQQEPLQFHVEDESISVERLFLAARIYAEALYRLAV